MSRLVITENKFIINVKIHEGMLSLKCDLISRSECDLK